MTSPSCTTYSLPSRRSSACSLHAASEPRESSDGATLVGVCTSCDCRGCPDGQTDCAGRCVDTTRDLPGMIELMELLPSLSNVYGGVSSLEDMVQERDQRIALLELHQRETDHRVKNSLQLVSSLVRAHTRRLARGQLLDGDAGGGGDPRQFGLEQ